MTSRREFIVQIGLAGGALATVPVWAQGAMLVDTEAPALALGYKTDATKADQKKYPKYAAGQQCGNCSLYQGQAKDASGPCPLFAGKQVAAKGWCSAWTKKA